MLDFFRRHQRYFFYVITVVIVISFSFFGTYDTMSNSSFREQIAFTAVDGTTVTRHELDEMVNFISTDAHDKMLFGGSWGPNFLNDGVIRKNFMETGLAAILAKNYANELQKDLDSKAEKERRFALYTNPHAPFIGTESAWNYFAPSMNGYFSMLRNASNPVAQDALQARIALFLMERQFPAPLLRQVLRFQEKQHDGSVADRDLDYVDLSLFGYHTIEDWFGPRFVRLVAEFIINSAIVAEQKGYEVSKADALADLMHNSEISYQQNVRNPNIGVKNSQEYFNEQLRRLVMDRSTAARQWQQVLLFRRLFQDMGSVPFIDKTTFAKFDEYALASVEGEIYKLPKELRLNNYRALQKLEIYLDAVSKRSDDDKTKLNLPTKFLSSTEVTQKTPELVQKRYLLEIAHVDKKSLEGTVGVRETWNWEVEPANWEILKKEFPSLGASDSKTQDERFAALDALDNKTRARVDAFARAAIVNAHPEWLEKALAQAESDREVVGLHDKGQNPPFVGLKDGKVLMQLLDKAPLSKNDGSLSPAAKEAAEQLNQFTSDQNNYYRIVVIDRAAQAEVMSFAEANQKGVLDQLLDSKLEAHYEKIRDANPKEFKRDDKSWKPYSDVKDAVADRYFEKVLKAISATYAAAIAPETPPAQILGDFAASWRLYPYMVEVKEKLQKDPADKSAWLRSPIAKSDNANTLPAQGELTDQWKLESSIYQTTRSNPEQILDMTETFAMKDNSWTKVNAPANGDLNFFHLKKKSEEANAQVVAANLSKAKRLLSDDAQQRLMSHLLVEIASKGAISLDYMNKNIESEVTEEE